MGQITVRVIDPEVEAHIREVARKTGKSMNQVILEMIYSYPGHQSERHPPCASLANLAGGWSQEEADGFFESIKPCERIDKEIWR